MTTAATLAGPAVAALRETSGFSPAERGRIIEIIEDRVSRPHPVDDAYVTVLADIGARDFEWPEFDRWQRLFADDRMFPLPWAGLEDRPCRQTAPAVMQAYRRRKIHLLVEWLHGLVVTRGEMRRALTRYTSLGLEACVVSQAIELSCPECLARHRARRCSDPDDIPPFHPGCRCLLLAGTPWPCDATPVRRGAGSARRRVQRQARATRDGGGPRRVPGAG
jgi:hypothetical protein